MVEKENKIGSNPVISTNHISFTSQTQVALSKGSKIKMDTGTAKYLPAFTTVHQ